MRFAIIGAGNVGTAIATALKGVGHDVIVSSDSEDDLEQLTAAVTVDTTTSNTEAVSDAEIIVFAVPFHAASDVAEEVADEVANKVVIDATNPLAADLSGLTSGDVSAAEVVQRAAPQARVVKAFNTVFASNQATAEVDGVQLDGFLAGDDTEAKSVVSDLLRSIGFRPVDVGPLSFARYLEGMALINIALNANNGWSWTSGWKLVGPLS